MFFFSTKKIVIWCLHLCHIWWDNKVYVFMFVKFFPEKYLMAWRVVEQSTKQTKRRIKKSYFGYFEMSLCARFWFLLSCQTPQEFIQRLYSFFLVAHQGVWRRFFIHTAFILSAYFMCRVCLCVHLPATNMIEISKTFIILCFGFFLVFVCIVYTFFC